MGIEHYNSLNDFDNQSYFQTKLTQLLSRDHLKPHLNKTNLVIGGMRSVQTKQRLSGKVEIGNDFYNDNVKDNND